MLLVPLLSACAQEIGLTLPGAWTLVECDEVEQQEWSCVLPAGVEPPVPVDAWCSDDEGVEWDGSSAAGLDFVGDELVVSCHSDEHVQAVVRVWAP